MMRVLTLICLFEIDDDIDVSYHFLSTKLCWLRKSTLRD
jgi:hypothetical protein